MKKSLFCAAVLSASPALATTYHVTPAGSDANTCSQAAPCRQIRRPLQLVGPGDTILVADGSYLGFDGRDVHGTPAAPVVIKAVGTAAVVVPTTDRRDNRDTIFVTFSSHVVIDGLRSFGANRAAVRVDESPRVTIRNGVFGDNTTWASSPPRGMQILHNTIDQAADGRWALLIHDTTGPLLVRNNILHNRHSFRGSIEFGNPQDAARTDSDHNVIGRVSTDEGSTTLTLAQWQAQGHDPHLLGAALASLFVNPAAADYHLAAASPALDRGQTLAQVTADLEGHPRPAGTASDIGAYEAGAAPAVPSLSVGDVSLPEGTPAPPTRSSPCACRRPAARPSPSTTPPPTAPPARAATTWRPRAP